MTTRLDPTAPEMPSDSDKAINTVDPILVLWEECHNEAVGKPELESIQRALENNLGVVRSPAQIARTLADHGVPLCHPEVLESDSRWRENQVGKGTDLRTLDFESIEKSVSSMKRLEELRKRLNVEGNESALQILFEQARELRLELQRRSTSLSQEVVEWLGIWLQNPEIFEEWMDLRRKSPEFQSRFASDP